jgi:hypothetical protein
MNWLQLCCDRNFPIAFGSCFYYPEFPLLFLHCQNTPTALGNNKKFLCNQVPIIKQT